MGTQYNGIPDNLAAILPASISIASSTDTSPIVLTTASPHNLTSGDRVGVFGHLTNTNANGLWKAQVTGLSTLQLLGSTATGAGAGSGGTLQSMGLGPTYAVAADGDPDAAATWNVADEALGDRTTLLAANMGRYRTLSWTQPLTINDDSTEVTVWNAMTLTSNNVWQVHNGVVVGSVNNLLFRDFLTVTLSCNALVATGTNILLGLYAAFKPVGGSLSSAVKLDGSGQYLSTSLGAGAQGLTLTGQVVVPFGQNVANFYVATWTSDAGALPFAVDLIGDASLTVNVQRRTDFSSRQV